MNILILGDIFGIPGVEAIKKNYLKLLLKKIDFVLPMEKMLQIMV